MSALQDDPPVPRVRCPACGYSLQGLAAQTGVIFCPECGAQSASTVRPQPGPIIKWRAAHVCLLIPALIAAPSFLGSRGAFGEPVGLGGLLCAAVFLYPFLGVLVPIALALERVEVPRSMRQEEAVFVSLIGLGANLALLLMAYLVL